MFGWAKDRLRRRMADLEARVEALELRMAEHRIELLDVVDQVTHRMAERERGRRRRGSPGGGQDEPEDHALGYARRFQPRGE